MERKKRNPDTRKLTKEQQELVERNMKLVRWVVRRYRSTRAVEDLGYEDAVSCGMIGLVKAAIRYDPNRGWKFSTFAVHWIRSSIQQHAPTSQVVRNPHDAYRQINGQMKNRVMSHSQSNHECDLTSHLTIESHEAEVDKKLDVETYLGCLKQKRRNVLVQAYSPNMTRRMLAEQKGCSYQNVDNIVRLAIHQIRYRHGIKPEDKKAE